MIFLLSNIILFTLLGKIFSRFFLIFLEFLVLDFISGTTISSNTCPRPYELVGTQCLFFSQPYLPWGLSESWAESYLNFYDAVALCRSQASNKGRKGDLATQVRNFQAAQKLCQRSRGGCAPSLIRRGQTCFQWSPLDGSEMEIPCRRWEVTMRYVCEIKP